MGRVSFFLFILCFLHWAEASKNSFLIKPYFYTAKGEKWALSWEFNPGAETHSKLTLIQNGSKSFLEATVKDGLYTASLPIPKCDFGNVSYQIEGTNGLTNINNVPCPESSGVTKFSFMADTQQGHEEDKIFAENIVKFNGSAVLIGGDLVQTGAILSEWVSFFDALNPVIKNQALVPVIGNHEYHGNRNVPLWELFFQAKASEDFYAIDIGPVHVMAINSCFTDEPSIKIKQLAWLENELAKPSRWRVVFFHHPPFSRSIMNSKQYPKKEWKTLRADYVPLFENYHVDLVLNGHTHIYEHSEKGGVQYLTMGPAGGVMGTYGSTNPYTFDSERVRTILEIEVTPQKLRAVTSTLKGEQLRELVLTK